MPGERPHVRVVSAEIHRDGTWLITRRPAHAVLPGLWEFPGGRVRDGESDAAALARSLRLRIGCDASVGDRILEVRHAYETYDLSLLVYRCDLGDAEPVVGSVAELRWVTVDQLADHEFPGADQATVEALLGAD